HRRYELCGSPRVGRCAPESGLVMLILCFVSLDATEAFATSAFTRRGTPLNLDLSLSQAGFTLARHSRASPPRTSKSPELNAPNRMTITVIVTSRRGTAPPGSILWVFVHPTLGTNQPENVTFGMGPVMAL